MTELEKTAADLIASIKANIELKKREILMYEGAIEGINALLKKQTT